jgi:hypothetical protein
MSNKLQLFGFEAQDIRVFVRGMSCGVLKVTHSIMTRAKKLAVLLNSGEK